MFVRVSFAAAAAASVGLLVACSQTQSPTNPSSTSLSASLPASASSVSNVSVPASVGGGQSQIVLSCSTPPPASSSPNGCRSSELATTPPIFVNGKLMIVGGFWVWCQSPVGGTPYGPDCTGSVYVEEVNTSTGAGVYDTTSISGGSSASGPTGLQVSFTSSDGDMACTLNVPTAPAKGENNTLSGTCDNVPISFSNTVVQVTR
jgi:hypothetical protein